MSDGKLKEMIINKATLGVGIEISFEDFNDIINQVKRSWVDLDEYFEEERSEVARHWFKTWFGDKK